MTASQRPAWRLTTLAAALLAVAGGIAARLVFLQIVEAEAYRVRAREQHENQVRIDGRRGTIWDRSGRELAVSIEAKSAYVQPRLITSAAVRERIILGASSALGQPASELRSIIENPKNRRFVFLRRRLNPRETKAILDLHLESIGLMDDTRRFYPRGPLAAHVLGFVDIDGRGQGGLERALDDVLRAEPASFISLMDARQRPLLLRTDAMGRPGRDLVVTLDEFIQHLAEAELERVVEETGAKGGTLIVMDPGTGEILALANRPGFDPNRPGDQPGRNREDFAVSYGYEPGSTFKLITASAAIEEKRAAPGDLFDCGNGSITLFGRRIGDHHPHGTLSLAQVIAKSSNVGIIRVGQRIATKTFCDYVSRFGFGRPTGIELPSEAPGVVQSPGGRTWSGLSQAMMSMGQSIVVTPLQMLVAVASIGSGGWKVTPRVVRSVTAEDGTPLLPSPDAPVRVLSDSTARAVTRMMESVVEEGTGKAAAIPGYRVAGKTGTAQKVVGGVYSHSAHVASFVGFAPASSPALAAIVVLDEPIGRYYGGDVAAPAFARVVGPSLAHLRVAPSEPIPRPAPRPETLRARSVGRSRAGILRARMEGSSSEPATPRRAFPATWPHNPTARPGTVPDLFGLDVRAALTALARSGCIPKLAGSGFVVEQAPPAGSPISMPGARDLCSISLAPELPADSGAGEGL